MLLIFYNLPKIQEPFETPTPLFYNYIPKDSSKLFLHNQLSFMLSRPSLNTAISPKAIPFIEDSRGRLSR
jgi:hypothetical protein